MSDTNRCIMMGFFLGYSQESVVAYLKRRRDLDNGQVNEMTPTSEGTKFKGTGYIPSQREIMMSPEEVISEINSRRLYSRPFPSFDIGLNEEYEAFRISQPELDVLIRWSDFQHYVSEELLLLEESHESHLRIDPERRVGVAV